jgi:hypothetical protein
MEYWKFEKLVREKTLYFSRSDKLEDDMEGKYAEANRNFTTNLWKKFCAAYSVRHDPRAQEQGALSFRHAVFINCWHINKVESKEMWQTFGKTERSIVVTSTVRNLLKAIADKIEYAGKVNYAPQEVPRPEWSHFAPFFYKDTQFMKEKEFRLVACKAEGEVTDFNRDIGRSFPIDPSEMIEMVKLHPDAPAAFKDEVKSLLATQRLKLPVSKSSLSRVDNATP